MRVAKRIPPRSLPAKRNPPKIPNPLPKTSSAPIVVEGNCIFYDLRAKAIPAPAQSHLLPPLLKNSVGRLVDSEERDEMRRLRLEAPQRWTITALAKKFDVCRSYVIKHILSEKEQSMAEEELVERIDSLSLNAKRGWIMRYRIREHRRDIW